MMARRDTSDPTGLGVFQDWGFSWPANRRILYNRASADTDGKPWDPSRKYPAWNGTSWAGGADVPDMRPDAAPDQGVGAFIMNPEGVARLHAVGMNEGPFPEHYEPFETPVGVNLMCPNNPKATSNPAARVYKGDLEAFGKKEEFPYAATTYRLTEHQHFWTKHARSNAIVQPAPFVEIGEELAKEKGIKQGDKVQGEEQPRPSGRGLRGHQAHQGAGRQRQEGAPGRHPDPLGLQGGDAERLPGQCIDTVRRRRQFADAGVQGVPRQHREGVRSR